MKSGGAGTLGGSIQLWELDERGLFRGNTNHLIIISWWKGNMSTCKSKLVWTCWWHYWLLVIVLRETSQHSGSTSPTLKGLKPDLVAGRGFPRLLKAKNCIDRNIKDKLQNQADWISSFNLVSTFEVTVLFNKCLFAPPRPSLSEVVFASSE